MRSRGDSATEVFTADSMAAEFGIMKGSFEIVPLPHGAAAHQAPSLPP